VTTLDELLPERASSLELRNLTKSFGDLTAVDDVSLSIEPGELVALLGPSGCGKTTTLRMLVGIETPSSGTISIEGVEVNELPPARRGVGLVFQDFAIFPHLTVARNLGFAPKMAGVPGERCDAMVREMAAVLDLTDLLDRRPRTLNPSELQRVSIGRTLVARPQIVLFDEPLSNVEAGLRARMRGELRTLHRRFRQTAVYVTHDQIEAMALADRVAVMNAGRIAQVASPDEIYADPASAFVAGFIGSPPMNVLAVEVEGGEARVGSLSVRLPAGWDPGSDTLQLGVRPEHVVLSAPGVETDGLLGCGTVVTIEPQGSEAIATVAGTDWKLTAVLEGAHLRSVSTGDNVQVAAASDQLRWFASTGERLRPPAVPSQLPVRTEH